MKLATFDIFDTTLIRKCGRPDVVAHIVAVRLWPDCEMAQCEFINARCQAAVAGRTNIEEFYSAEELSALSGYTADEIMHAEMDVESEMLMANVAVQEQIGRLRAEGWTIKFLSDMYLPSSLLKQVLLREECAEADDEVIVSCEWNARKDSGELYRRVREAYGPAEWRHYGDNRHSDYKMARRYGVKATLVNSEFTPMEQRISAESARLRDGWRYDLLAGLSRTARLSCGDTPANRLAADYVAALYVPFVVWVLRSAEMAGIRRLHFLSRDGYIMMKIAEALGTDLQLNYLFVSRKALMRAYLSENAAQRYLEIADRKTIVRRYVDVLLSQLQLDRNSLAEQYGIRFDYNRIVTSVQQQDFVDKIFNHPQFTPRLMAAFADDACLTEDYLKQEGLADGTPQAMVDIGWLGTSRLMVNSILASDIPTYYLGVRADVYPRSCGDYNSYFACGQLSTELTGLIENYFSASPWPSTLGYARGADGRIAPKFADAQNFTETAATRANVDTCCRLARDIAPYIHLFDNDLLFRWAETSFNCLATLKDKIDLTPISENCEFDGIPMVRKFSLFELFNCVFLGGRYTTFDRGCLQMTLGPHLANYAWAIRSKLARVKNLVYRLYSKQSK